LSVVDTSVLVALSVYQLIVKNTLPESSKSVPVVGQSDLTIIMLKCHTTIAAAAAAAACHDNNKAN